MIILFMLVCAACSGDLEPTNTPPPAPTNTPQPTPPPMPQQVSVDGPDCPDSFQESQPADREVEIGVGGSLTLTVGSTPSIPCSWHPPEISEPTVVRQVDHQSQWPAEGATPQPGAPGTEIWVFETLEEGESTITLRCTCLGEEGEGEETQGEFVLNVISAEAR